MSENKTTISMEALKQQFENYQDNTDYLRNCRNSRQIGDDIIKMEKLKRTYTGDKQGPEFVELCRVECRFLYDHFMYLFHKLLKDVVDLKMMFSLLKILQDIENGVINQEEGSVIVGKILKELYLDCATREGQKYDLEDADKLVPWEGKSINWKQYRLRQTTTVKKE